MSVYYNTDELPILRNPVITIGTFDGVHLGHRTIIQEVIKHARQLDGDSVLLTFEPHPRKIIFPEIPLKLLTPPKQKLERLSSEGVEHVIVVPFTPAFANLSAEEYIRNFLVGHFQPRAIVIGYDHHFGHDRTGNIQLLQQYAETFGYQVYEIPAQLIDEAAISSTKIRNALNEGNVAEAAHMLTLLVAK
jgi:riboflavin kinase/FMN adenylyltransferase